MNSFRNEMYITTLCTFKFIIYNSTIYHCVLVNLLNKGSLFPHLCLYLCCLLPSANIFFSLFLCMLDRQSWGMTTQVAQNSIFISGIFYHHNSTTHLLWMFPHEQNALSQFIFRPHPCFGEQSHLNTLKMH